MTDQDVPQPVEDPREISDAQAEAMSAQAELGLHRRRPPAGEPVGGAGTGSELADVEAIAAADPRTKAELLAALTDAEHARDDAMAERDEYLDHLQRRAAEFDNFRKRTMQEKANERSLGRADVARALIEVLDDFERTVQALGPEDAHPEAAEWAANLEAGVRAVHGKLSAALVALGMERIDQIDVAFDPTRHEGVQTVPTDQPLDQPVVAQILRPGYELGSQVLRAAMVAVRQ